MLPDSARRHRHRHHGRQPHVAGGYPHPVEIRLTTDDRAKLAQAAGLAELADGAYASQLVHRGLAADAGTVPADWREVLAQLMRHRAEVAALRAAIAAIGRLFNQIARAVSTGGHAPAAAVLARLGQRVEALLDTAEERLAELDELTTKARARL